jgi:hypothetical protein
MKQRLENITSVCPAETFERDEPDMHVTHTVDYAMVLEGADCSQIIDWLTSRPDFCS